MPEGHLTLSLDLTAMRGRPWAPHASALLGAIPEWRQFTRGSSLDIARDVENVVVIGESLRDLRRDTLLVRYSAKDEDVEKAIAALTSQRTGEDSKRSSYDLGVVGVRAWHMHVGHLERTFVRGPAHVLLVAPSEQAHDEATALLEGRLNATPSDDRAFVSLRVVKPTAWAFVPAGVNELRGRILLRPDDGAEALLETDCADTETAKVVGAQLDDRLKSVLGSGTSEAPSTETRIDGATAKSQVRLTRADVESLLDFIGTALANL